MKDYVWVFKTNIRTHQDLVHLSDVFSETDIIRWTVDTEDCDAVLRVETSSVDAAEIILLITNKGYECSELTD